VTSILGHFGALIDSKLENVDALRNTEFPDFPSPHPVSGLLAGSSYSNREDPQAGIGGKTPPDGATSLESVLFFITEKRQIFDRSTLTLSVLTAA